MSNTETPQTACRYAAQWERLSDHRIFLRGYIYDVRDCIDAMIIPEVWCDGCRAAGEQRCGTCGSREAIDAVTACPACCGAMCPNCADVVHGHRGLPDDD